LLRVKWLIAKEKPTEGATHLRRHFSQLWDSIFHFGISNSQSGLAQGFGPVSTGDWSAKIPVEVSVFGLSNSSVFIFAGVHDG
jgi:hypothetical protein